jgi:hypothetical protein
MPYSFDSWGVHNGQRIYYTSTTSTGTADDFDGFKALIDRESLLQKSWIWVFDCHGMKTTDYTNVGFVHRMKHMIEVEHAKSLKAVWILNINGWMRSMLALFGPTKVQVLPADRLEMLVQLQKAACPVPLVDSLLRTIRG